jgi:hypothetical protein
LLLLLLLLSLHMDLTGVQLLLQQGLCPQLMSQLLASQQQQQQQQHLLVH